MSTIIHLIFILVFLNNTSSYSLNNCSPKQLLFIEDKCRAYANRLGNLLDIGGSGTEYANNVTNTCHTVSDCFGAINCSWGQNQKKKYDDDCEKFHFYNYNVNYCISKFYDAVYHEVYNCSKDFRFFSKDTPSRREAYTNGKSCFLEIVGKECSEPANSYLNSNYETFLNFMTTPNDMCHTLHNELMRRQCYPMARVLGDLTVGQIDHILHTKRDSNLSKICKDMKECIDNECHDEGQERYVELCEEFDKKWEEDEREVNNLSKNQEEGRNKDENAKIDLDKLL
ncbi:unnamed protein product [Caenorhabditis brenneri]